MAELFDLLPNIILYLASGFAFICGYYFLIDKRFDFFSEISFWIMLILGFLWTNLIKALPNLFHVTGDNVKNVIVVLGSLFIGLAVALIRNYIEKRQNDLLNKMGRKKTFSSSFWYELLDDPDKPITVRLRNEEKKYILQGVLLRVSEDDKDPYLLLGYCVRYSLEGKVIDKSLERDKRTQIVVKPSKFDEILFIYSEGSSKIIDLEFKDKVD